MTKAELIRKIAKRSGVPDSEAKIFFEIFLKRISVLLKPGEAIKLNAFGYFNYRKALVQSKLSTSAEKISTDYSDLIVFSPIKEEPGNEIENLIFNIPSYIVENESYNLLDSYFSISIGKPVVPLQGVKDTEFFIPPTGSELRKLIETKVDKLFHSAEIITEHTKGNEYLIIKPELTAENQFELQWDSKQSSGEDKKKKTSEEKEVEQPSEFNHIAWDFGEDLSRQIEEESILDVGTEPENISSLQVQEDNENISWDFGSTEEADIFNETVKNSYDAATKISGEKEKAKNHFDDEEQYEDKSEANAIVDNFTTREFEERVVEDLKKYQRVRAITKEMPDEDEAKVKKTKDNLDWDFGKEQTDFEEIEHFVNNFDETKESEITRAIDSGEVLLEEKELSEMYIEKEKLIVKESEKVKGQKNAKLSLLAGKDDKKGRGLSKDYISGTKTREYSYSNKRSPLVFFIALVTILSVSAALFFYLKNVKLKLFNSQSARQEKVLNASAPEIINRNFEIPVNYPYTKSDTNNNLAQLGIDPNALMANNQKTTNQPAVEKSNLSSLLNNSAVPGKNEPVKKEPEKKKDISPVNKIEKNKNTISSNEKVKENIYKSGNSFIVQVSSWKSKSIAEREVNRYKSGGYHSFLEEAIIPGRGIWYRVKVGNFKTIAEAENFSKRLK